MAALLVELTEGEVKEIPLEKERVTIGRRSTNDVVLPHMSVSAQHAVVVTSGDECWIEDLGSRNGVSVNGKSVARHRLSEQDVIQVGRHRIVFRSDAVIVAGARRGKGGSAGRAPESAAATKRAPVPASESAPALPETPLARGTPALAGGRQPARGGAAAPTSAASAEGASESAGGSERDPAVSGGSAAPAAPAASRRAAKTGPVPDPGPAASLPVLGSPQDWLLPTSTSRTSLPPLPEAKLRVRSGQRAGTLVPVDRHFLAIGRAGVVAGWVVFRSGAFWLVPADDSGTLQIAGRGLTSGGTRLAAGDVIRYSDAEVEFVGA